MSSTGPLEETSCVDSLLPSCSGIRARLIILDFDGTIVESVDIKTEAFRELFSTYSADLDHIMAYHLGNNGISRDVKFKHIYEKILGLPYNAQRREETARRFSELVFDRVVTCPLVVGAKAFLEAFSKRVWLYVVSASPETELRRVVGARGLGRDFCGVFGSPATKLDHARRILSREAASPGAAIYVGDSIEDYRVARELGIPFIGRQNKEDLSELGVPVYPDLDGVAAEVEKRLTGIDQVATARRERKGMP